MSQTMKTLNGYEIVDNYARTQITAEKAALKQEIATERKRIDALASLPEGSTAGDAELVDAHIDYTGKNWESTGAHIRGVTSQLSEQIVEIQNFYDNLGYATNEAIDRNNITVIPSNGNNTINGTPTANIGFDISEFVATDSMVLTIKANFIAKNNCRFYVTDVSANGTVVTAYGGDTKTFDVVKGKRYKVSMYIAGYTVWNNEFVSCVILSPKISAEDFKNGLKLIPAIVTSSNPTITDVNNVPMNSIYRFATRSIPENMPQHLPNPLNCLLYTVNYGNMGSIQYILDVGTYEVLWYRFETAEWHSVEHKITVGKGSGDWDFSTLYEALLFAYSNHNTTIEVHDGTYNIIEEMGDNLTNESIGILLGKNMVINFKPHAYVVCNYEGDDTNIKGIFSPFYSGMGNFEVNNMKLSCSNVRYCVHDEKSDGADAYTHKYNNCSFYLDNRNNTHGYPQCIGGGLGKNGHIEIVGCSFKSETISEDGEKAEASYHNSSASEAKSEVIVKDNYFENGTFRISYYGASTEKTYAYVSNNAVKYAPYVTQESSSYDLQNVVLREWNNVIHS